MNYVLPGRQTELNRIATLYADIETNINNHDYIHKVTNDIGYYQPFFLLILNQYKIELDEKTKTSFLKLYFLLWLFYRRKIKVRDWPITSERYMLAEYEISNLLSPEIQEDEQLYDILESPGSKAMITTILHKFKKDPDFKLLLTKSDNTILISVYSLICCFDEITTKRWP